MSQEPFSVASYRALAVLAAFLVLGFALADLTREVGAPLPIAERLLVGAVCGTYALLTAVSDRARAHAGTLFRVLVTAVTLWTLTGPARFGFAVNDGLGFLATVICVGLVFPGATGVIAFYSAVSVAFLGAHAVAPTSEVPVPTLIGSMVCGLLVTLAVARARRGARSEVEEMRLLTSRIENAAALLDRSGRVRWFNEGFTRLVGPVHPLGVNFAELLLVPPTEPEAALRLARHLKEGKGGRAEVALRRADGLPSWVAADLSPSGPPGAAVEGFVVVLSDTSRSRATVARIVDAMSDALFIVGADGRVESANPAALRLLDVPEATLVGAPFTRWVVPDWRWSADLSAEPASSPGTGSELLALLLEGELEVNVLRDLDLALRREDGEVVPVLAAASVLRAEGEDPRRLVLVARDARERRRLEAEQRTLAQRAQESHRLESLGNLAGGFAHTFNNLLVTLLGNASLLAGRLRPDDPNLPVAVAIERAAQRAADLTQQVLAYSGKGQFTVETLDLTELVRGMAGLIEASAGDQTQLSLQLDPDTPLVDGDAAQLRQVVVNLVGNAVDAVGGTGVVRVRTWRGTPDPDLAGVRGDDLRGQPCACLEVVDDGDGLEPHVLARVFEPFALDARSVRGMRLPATLGIVRGHRGAIAVESRRGEGTRVRVWFPVASPADPPPLPREPTPVPPEPPRVVLVVDDEDEVREFMVEVLRGQGHEVLQARDGSEALEVYDAHATRIGAVVLDLTMPVMDGETALRHLRARNPDLPVVLSSGFSATDARKRHQGHAVTRFLQKPYRAAALLEAVEAALEPEG